MAGTIEKIVSDKVVSEVVVRTGASIITTGSVERMNVKQGDNVFAIIKATEVSVEKEHVADPRHIVARVPRGEHGGGGHSASLGYGGAGEGRHRESRSSFAQTAHGKFDAVKAAFPRFD